MPFNFMTRASKDLEREGSSATIRVRRGCPPPQPRICLPREMKPRSDEFFRAGVGALLTDGRGNVLAFERADASGAWQLPQGGLLAGEDPSHGVLRELEEETGIRAHEVELLGRHPEPLVYELPPEMRTPRTGRGQVHFWFAFRYLPRGGGLHLPPEGEFRDSRWLPLTDLVEEVVEFRRPVYRKLLEWLRAFPSASARGASG
jgi:putative (di)nucleoside polyphosphate hydrolase